MATTSPTRGLPLPAVLALTLAVWVSSLWHHAPHIQPTAVRSPGIRWGTAAELAPSIRRSPRSVVFVGCPMSTVSTLARKRFLDAATQMGSGGVLGGEEFFVIEDETAEDSIAWAKTFRDDRLTQLGSLANGWVLWLENGRLREVEPDAGLPCYTARHIVDGTHALWP
jgi:hypothetical protein